MNETEPEAITIAADLSAPARPVSIARRIQAAGDFISHAVAVAFFVAIGAVGALAAVVVVTVLAPLFFAVFVQVLRRRDQARIARCAA